MGIKNDWLEKQIEEIGNTTAAVLFGKDKFKKTYEKLKENNQKNKNEEMNDMVMNVLVDSYVKNGELAKAEETLFSFAENQKTAHILTSAIFFYNKLLALNEEKLNESGFSKERINQGIEKLKQLYKE